MSETCSNADCDISPAPSGASPHPPTPFSGHPLIQNAPVPWEQYLLLTERGGGVGGRVTCFIISEQTFDLTYTEEAENNCRWEGTAG